jgi:hypothetical protein
LQHKNSLLFITGNCSMDLRNHVDSNIATCTTPIEMEMMGSEYSTRSTSQYRSFQANNRSHKGPSSSGSFIDLSENPHIYDVESVVRPISYRQILDQNKVAFRSERHHCVGVPTDVTDNAFDYEESLGATGSVDDDSDDDDDSILRPTPLRRNPLRSIRQSYENHSKLTEGTNRTKIKTRSQPQPQISSPLPTSDDDDQVPIGEEYQCHFLPLATDFDMNRTPILYVDDDNPNPLYRGDILWDPTAAERSMLLLDLDVYSVLEDFEHEFNYTMLLMEAIHRAQYNLESADDELSSLISHRSLSGSFSVLLNDQQENIIVPMFRKLKSGASLDMTTFLSSHSDCTESNKPVVPGKWRDPRWPGHRWRDIFHVLSATSSLNAQTGSEMVLRPEAIVVAYYRWKSSSPEYQAIKTKRDNEPDECALCGDGGYLIVCDRCGGVFHPTCFKPPISVPDGEWFCPPCCQASPSRCSRLLLHGISAYTHHIIHAPSRKTQPSLDNETNASCNISAHPAEEIPESQVELESSALPTAPLNVSHEYSTVKCSATKQESPLATEDETLQSESATLQSVHTKDDPLSNIPQNHNSSVDSQSGNEITAEVVDISFLIKEQGTTLSTRDTNQSPVTILSVETPLFSPPRPFRQLNLSPAKRTLSQSEDIVADASTRQSDTNLNGYVASNKASLIGLHKEIVGVQTTSSLNSTTGVNCFSLEPDSGKISFETNKKVDSSGSSSDDSLPISSLCVKKLKKKYKQDSECDDSSSNDSEHNEDNAEAAGNGALCPDDVTRPSRTDRSEANSLAKQGKNHEMTSSHEKNVEPPVTGVVTRVPTSAPKDHTVLKSRNNGGQSMPNAPLPTANLQVSTNSTDNRSVGTEKKKEVTTVTRTYDTKEMDRSLLLFLTGLRMQLPYFLAMNDFQLNSLSFMWCQQSGFDYPTALQFIKETVRLTRQKFFPSVPLFAPFGYPLDNRHHSMYGFSPQVFQGNASSAIPPNNARQMAPSVSSPSTSHHQLNRNGPANTQPRL